MKIVIPMSGMSSRFSAAGYIIPKYLIELNGKKAIEHIVNLFSKEDDFIFIINQKHKEETDIESILKSICKNSTVVSLPCHKNGPVFSVNQFDVLIDDEEPVIINYCDFSMGWNYQDFLKFVKITDCDGSVVCYKGFHPHMLGSDNYAFCKTDYKGNVVEIREKQPFTDNKMNEYASSGTYYFKKGEYVKKYFKELIDKDHNINGEYYVSLVYNLLIKHLLRVNVYEVPYMLQWGTPFDVYTYQKWSGYYEKTLNWQKRIRLENTVTVLPMAGAGSRFSKEGYDIPKPFIELNGDYMVNQAIKCLPLTDEVVYGRLKTHTEHVLDGTTVWIDEVLPGQAHTTSRILEEVDKDKSILISACDNGVFYDEENLKELIEDKTNDIIIWSYRNNPTSFHNPQMYSWLDVDENQDVSKVNVKNFTKENPLDEYAIVGTMFFRNKEIYNVSFNELIKSNEKVNNEFYVDSLINQAIKLGYKVKNFEVDEYICWGTPNDLKTYLYWQQFFNGVQWHPYEYNKDFFTNTILG